MLWCRALAISLRTLLDVVASWLIVADPFGSDKALHAILSSLLVVILVVGVRLRVARVAWVVVGVGVALEFVQGVGGSTGLAAPSPLGGDAELADVAADAFGVFVGASLCVACRAAGRVWWVRGPSHEDR